MKIKDLIDRLEDLDQEKEIYIFKDGAYHIDTIGNLIQIEDLFIFVGEEYKEFKQKVLSKLDIKFEPRD